MGNYTLSKENKAHFAAYYNMARRNCHSILKYISRISGVTGFDVDEDKVQDIDIKVVIARSRAEHKDYIIRRLVKHFPLIKPMVEKEKDKDSKSTTLEDISPVLTNLFKVIHAYRNNYTHYSEIETRCEDLERRVASYLNECFTVSVRIIKERYALTNSEIAFINDYRYIDSRTEKDSKGRALKVPNPRFEYTIINEERTITQMGKIFLVSLFIEKKYASLFFDALGNDFYFKYKDPKQRMIIREIFSVFSIRLPRERIDSERNDMMLALDMLNELKKAPAELFDNLTDDDKEQFRVKVEDEDTMDESTSAEDSAQILLKRYSDRFPQLALRYIDDTCAFSNIRFQVNYGKYRSIFTDSKKCIDGIERVRVIQKELNGFGRINEIEKRRTGDSQSSAIWDGVALIRSFEEVSRDNTSLFPYITDSRTQYLFNGDKIGIGYYHNTKIRSGIYMPNTQDGDVNIKPVCWLSRYEIPAMIFHLLLYKQINQTSSNSVNTEKIIIESVKCYNQLFKDLSQGKITYEIVKCADKENPQRDEYKFIEDKYKIAWSNIPRKIRDIMVGRNRDSFKEYAKPIIENMIADTARKLERFSADLKRVSSSDNKMGKKRYVEIRTGSLASYLARDILMFQPTYNGGRDKLTGLNYRVMQASIAVFNTNAIEGQSFSEFYQMFMDAKIIGKNSSNKHPFLQNVLKKEPKNTIEFYELYLEERISHLKEIYAKGKYGNLNFLRQNRSKWATKNEKYFKKLADEYLANPIELPRGLFEDSIKQMLLTLCESNSAEYANLIEIAKKEQCSVTYLISKYMQLYMKDSTQEFYTWSREYNLFKTLDPNHPAKTLEERDIDIREAIELWKVKRVKEVTQQIDNYIKNGLPKGKDQSERAKLNAFESSIVDYITENIGAEFSRKLSRYKSEKQRAGKWGVQPKHPARDYISKYQTEFVDTYVKVELNRLKQDAKQFDKNERALRRYQVQDILLFIMAKDIIINREVPLSDFRLSEITLNSDTSILSSKIPEFKVKLSFNSGKHERTIIITEKNIKIKNYGNFMRLLHDSRLESMINFITKKNDGVEIDRNLIERELDRYDTIRPQIFSTVFDIEKSVVDKFSNLTKDDKQNFRRLISHINMGETDKEILIAIRNKFGHNEYPYYYINSDNEEHLLLTESNPEPPEIAKTIKERFEKAAKNS